MSKRLKSEVYSWVVVIIIVLILREIFVMSYVIPTGSMESTLLIGDALLVNRFIYGMKFPFTNTSIIPGRMPHRSEIIVFRYPFENRDFVKRCIAVEGDTIEIINKEVYVNDKSVDEPYAYHRDERMFEGIQFDQRLYQKLWQNAELPRYVTNLGSLRDNFGPVVVPKDHVFAMGDNRDNSHDSRFWGPLHRRYLRGKPLFIFFSFDPGREATNLIDILKIWQWQAIRLMRIGKVI